MWVTRDAKHTVSISSTPGKRLINFPRHLPSDSILTNLTQTPTEFPRKINKDNSKKIYRNLEKKIMGNIIFSQSIIFVLILQYPQKRASELQRRVKNLEIHHFSSWKMQENTQKIKIKYCLFSKKYYHILLSLNALSKELQNYKEEINSLETVCFQEIIF